VFTGSDATLSGVFAIDDMKELGRERHWCPYFMARRMINLADVVVYNYQYMLGIPHWPLLRVVNE
jgi:DNA excision repair protein ERCC-2